MTRGVAIAALAVLATTSGACHGNNPVENVIVPVVASVILDPPPSGGPLVLLRQAAGDNPQDDLVIFDVVLQTSSLVSFDAFNIEAHFDPGLIQFSSISGGTSSFSSILGTCGSSTTSCDPLCGINSEPGPENVNRTGILLIGVALQGVCPAKDVSSDDTLITIGFRAATRIPNNTDGRIELVYTGSTSNSVLLRQELPLSVPFYDRNATIVTN